MAKMIICSAPMYEYKGWFFEFHKYIGPWPLKKDGDPRKRAGRAFYKMIDGFRALPDDEQEKYRVGGGCLFV